MTTCLVGKGRWPAAGGGWMVVLVGPIWLLRGDGLT